MALPAVAGTPSAVVPLPGLQSPLCSPHCRPTARYKGLFPGINEPIAHRSAQLAPATPALWSGVLLDSFSDLVASKMVALVERGAPRDFRDIYALCQAGLTTPQECWELWRRRQQLAGSDTNSDRARLAVETHLTRIAQHRPLPEISDPQKRAEAEKVRQWFAGDFLNALYE